MFINLNIYITIGINPTYKEPISAVKDDMVISYQLYTPPLDKKAYSIENLNSMEWNGNSPICICLHLFY